MRNRLVTTVVASLSMGCVGVNRDVAKIDVWLRQVAPTTQLRKWFNHDPRKWDQFKSRYFQQLDECPDVITELLAKAKKSRLTLLFAAKDPKHNNAMALKMYLVRRFRLRVRVEARRRVNH